MSLRIASPGAAFPDLGVLTGALSTCTTEADIAQVLYARLSGPLGYDVVNLQVLERDGWMHRIVVDQGVLQDVRRLRVETSYFAEHYRKGETYAGHSGGAALLEHARGPGSAVPPRTYVWVPVHHRGQLVAAVIYQMHERRLIPDDELAYLGDLHRHLGALIVNAYLHELTRNQALSLGALNDLAGELATTHDEAGIASGLLATLGHRVGIDSLEIVVPPRDGAELRSVRAPAPKLKPGEPGRRRDLAQIRRVIASHRPLLVGERGAGGRSIAYVPILGEQAVDAVLVACNDLPDAYEESTLEFLLQVADHVAPALHNAWSFAVREEQRRRLEVVAAVGQRLAGAVDRPTIVRALRDELSTHIAFDVFAIALVEEREGYPAAETYFIEGDGPLGHVSRPLRPDDPVWLALESGRSQVIHATSARTGKAIGPVDGLLRERRDGGPMRSHLLVPVPGSGALRCEIVLQAAAADGFGLSDLRLVEDLGGQLRLALATADMFGRMRGILEHSPVGVVLQEPSGTVSFVNPAMASIYGVPRERLIGSPASRLLEEVAATPLDGDRSDGGARRYRLGTREAVVEVRTVAVPAEGDRPASMLQLHEDVTREQTLQEAKDLMLRAIGHEVRSPAAAIRTTIAVLVDWLPTMSPEQQRALLESAYEQSERLLHVAEAQLMIARLEQGDIELDPQPFEVLESLDRVRRLLVHRYGDRALSVSAGVPPDLPLAMAVPTHFDEVLTNLIGNALEHTDSGEIRVQATAEGDRLRIAVEDQGAGLPSHRLNRIFERGGPPGSHRARGGLGLGLYLCRLIVERSFGGHIEVTRTGPDGTRVEFTVPARRRLPHVVRAEAPA